MSDKPKQIKLYKYLGATLIDRGQWFLWKAFGVKFTRTITKDELKNFLVGLGIDRNRIYCADQKYYLIDWEVMKNIIEHDWTDKREYLVDKRDCDDFANAFKSNLSIIYGVNSVGLAKSIQVKIDDKTIYHRANLILATENDILRAYVFEAQNDGWNQLTKGVPIVIGNWEYKLGSFDF